MASTGEVPDGRQTAVLLVGTQFPDLVDKPLAWSLALLPNGRSLAHSLLFAVPLLVVLWLVLWRTPFERYVAPFAVGYLTHLLADLPAAVLTGEFTYATYLLWPVLPSPVYDVPQSFATNLQYLKPTPVVLVQFLFAFLGLSLWVLDGMPLLPIRRRGSDPE